ncbi:MAG: VOC family protein [Pseudomonadota bacterium]
MKVTQPLVLAAIFAIATPSQAEPPKGTGVTGFGGFFFRAENPAALADWYLENLGIDKVPTTYEVEPWSQEAGPTVFSPFPADAETFAPEGKSFVLNFRTNDLDGLVAHLRSNGSEVTIDEELYPNGRFAGLEDPEGNPIQLWEPKDPTAEE